MVEGRLRASPPQGAYRRGPAPTSAGDGDSAERAQASPYSPVTGASPPAPHASCTQVDVMLTAGGVGPTLDDVTMEGIACALGRPLEPNPELVARLKVCRDVVV